MIVEDDVLVRMMVADELRHQNYTVIEAATAHAWLGCDLGVPPSDAAHRHPVLSVRPAVVACWSRDRQSAQHMVLGLARHHHGSWLADDDRWHHPHCRAAGCDCDRLDHLWRPRPHDRGRADRRRAGRFPQL